MKHPIHLSQNLSVKILAEINKIPADLKKAHEKKKFWLRVFRGDMKLWLFENPVVENENEEEAS